MDGFTSTSFHVLDDKSTPGPACICQLMLPQAQLKWEQDYFGVDMRPIGSRVNWCHAKEVQSLRNYCKEDFGLSVYYLGRRRCIYADTPPDGYFKVCLV